MALLATLVTALAISPFSYAYNVFININQAPAQMVRQPQEWSHALRAADGLLAMGAPNPTDPMNRNVCNQLISMFSAKQKIMNTLWGFMTGERKANVNYSTYPAYVASKYPAMNLDAEPKPQIFMWDIGAINQHTGSGTLTLSQLDLLQNAGFRKVLILARYKDSWVKSAVMHPMVSGVVIEGNPDTWIRPILRLNDRMQLAKFVISVGKPLYLLLPPGSRGANAPAAWQRPYPDRLKDMLASLESLFGTDYVCGNELTFIMSGYGGGVEWVPDLGGNGEAADSVTGTLVWLDYYRQMKCGN